MPSTYPIALAVSKDGQRAFVALWNASEIVELDLKKNTVGRKLALLKPTSPIAPGTHPVCVCAFAGWQDDVCCAGESRCSCSGECGGGAVCGEGLLRYAAAGAKLLWRGAGGCRRLNANGSRLYVANAASDAVAVIDTTKLTAKAVAQRNGRACRICAHGVDADVDGVSSVASGGKLYRGDGKGKGNGAESHAASRQDTEAGTRYAEADELHCRRCSMGRWRC